MSWFRRKINGNELEALKDEADAAQRARREATRRLVRTAETISRQRQENERAAQIERFRINEGAAE